MWRKIGHIFAPSGRHHWDKSHAQVPVADVLPDRIRVYYASRNELGQSNVSFIEVSKENPGQVIYVHNEVLFDFGKPGTFDDSGIMPSSVISVGDKKFLYYVGWTTRKTVPYQNAVGLAVSEDQGITFSKYSDGPIICVNRFEPYFSGTSYVIIEGSKFKMWYLSCIGWERFNGKLEPLYNIKYAESSNGIDWQQTGTVAIDLEEDEGGLVSASVIKSGDVYRMWYGKRKKQDYRENRSNSYRIGYAESLDGVSWVRIDGNSGLDVSVDGWDSEMVSYPNVVIMKDEPHMFYNGNGFGKSGFGYAIWKPTT